MSEPNLKAMTQAELLKYLEDDFMPRLLPKLANVQNIESENARLKAEVERLTENTDKLCKHGDLEIERLKAEVERLRASSFVTAVPVEEYEKLKAEVERLRKAGDAMRWLIECQNDDAYYGHNEEHAEAVKAWNAAKEGKQP